MLVTFLGFAEHSWKREPCNRHDCSVVILRKISQLSLSLIDHKARVAEVLLLEEIPFDSTSFKRKASKSVSGERFLNFWKSEDFSPQRWTADEQPSNSDSCSVTLSLWELSWVCSKTISSNQLSGLFQLTSGTRSVFNKLLSCKTALWLLHKVPSSGTSGTKLFCFWGAKEYQWKKPAGNIATKSSLLATSFAKFTKLYADLTRKLWDLRDQNSRKMPRCCANPHSLKLSFKANCMFVALPAYLWKLNDLPHNGKIEGQTNTISKNNQSTLIFDSLHRFTALPAPSEAAALTVKQFSGEINSVQGMHRKSLQHCKHQKCLKQKLHSGEWTRKIAAGQPPLPENHAQIPATIIIILNKCKNK